MKHMEMLKRLEIPNRKIDVVLDTDTYNEVDDQFALAYLLRSNDKLNCLALYAAPYTKGTVCAKEGMEKSYREIYNILELCGRQDMFPCVYKGSEQYLPDEKTPVVSAAAQDLVRLANEHNGEDLLYVIAIGAITNVASAILLDPTIIEKMVVVWLGGHALHWNNTWEYNMMQDVAAARVVMGCGVPMIQLPCEGVVSEFAVSLAELKQWLEGANPLCDYLIDIVAQYEKRYSKGLPWSKQIWDVTAVAALLNDGERFMRERIIHMPIPQYDFHYSLSEDTHFMKYIWKIQRSELLADLFAKLKQ